MHARAHPGARPRSETADRRELLSECSEVPFRATRLGRWPSEDADNDLLAVFPAKEGIPIPTTGTIVVELPDGPVTLAPTDLAPHLTPLDVFAENHLAPLDPAVRAQLTEELIEVVWRSGVLADSVTGLATLREILRTAYSVSEVHPAADFAAQIDGIWRIDERSFYIEGWVFDRRDRLENISSHVTRGTDSGDPRRDVAISAAGRFGFPRGRVDLTTRVHHLRPGPRAEPPHHRLARAGHLG